MPGEGPLTVIWPRRIVGGAAVLYLLLAVLCLVGWVTADDPLGALPAVILGLPWSPLVGRLSALAPTNQLWLGVVLALPMVVNLGLLALLYRWLSRHRKGAGTA